MGGRKNQLGNLLNGQRTILLAIVIVLNLVLIGLTIFSLNSSPKTAYVKANELFEEFKGKQELEAKFTANGTEQQSMLDTLAMEIASLTNQLMEQPNDQALQSQKRKKQLLYRELQQQFTEQNSNQNQQYTESILKQINQYTLEYGKEHGYDYIFGASGNGSLMYATDAKDITKEVLNYINKKYEGL